MDQSSAAPNSDGDEKKKGSTPSSSTSAKRAGSQKSASEASRGTPVISFNAKTQSDKLRLLEDIQVG